MTVFLLIFFLLMIVYAVLIDFYRRSWNAIPQAVLTEQVQVLVSVIVAVRNEEHTIARLIECLQRQHYPKHRYEVVLVDDHSTDKTLDSIRRAIVQDMNILVVELGHDRYGKKEAIAAGVRSATGELVLTTDADCGMEPTWIGTMAAFYTQTNACFIAAPVYMKGGRGFLNIFQSLDFLTLQGITGASVFRRFHSMCNGANLAYQKSTFEEVHGFEGIDHIASGDDMLLMHKIALKYPDRVFYLKHRDALVTTPAEKSWKEFFRQRIRWASKAVHYRDRKVFYVLLLTYVVNTCFLALGAAAFIQPRWLAYLLLFLLAKIVIEFPFVNTVSIFFGRTRLMMYFPLLEPCHILYTVVAGWLGRFSSYTWKARVIKNN